MILQERVLGSRLFNIICRCSVNCFYLDRNAIKVDKPRNYIGIGKFGY